MALLIEAVCVVIRRDAIKRKFFGGEDGFMRSLPNSSLCAEESLARLSFMAPGEAAAFIAQLEKAGLRFVKDEKAFDIAVVDQTQGPTAPCDWLEFRRAQYKSAEGEPGGVIASVSYKGLPGKQQAQADEASEADTLITPPYWQYAGSLSEKFVAVPQGKVTDRMTFLRSEGNFSYFLDTESGEEVGIYRAQLPNE